MTQVPLEEARSRLDELIAGLKPGEELQITLDDRPVAKLVGEPSHPRTPRQPGSAVGRLIILSEDDDHLEDFRDYIP